MKGDKSSWTDSVERAMKFYEDMKVRLAKEFSLSVGYEEVSRKETRQLIRDSIQGDKEAFAKLKELHQANQYPDGRNPVQEEINLALKQHKEGMSDMFKPVDIFGE